MPSLFGYQIEPDFDEAKEDRGSRASMFLVGGGLVAIVYLFLGFPFATQVFQGLFATILPYGSSFYVDRQTNLRRLWVWKAILATLPIHTVYLVVIFYSDAKLPGLMMKAAVFIPVLALGFALESGLVFDRIVKHFGPREPERSTEQRSEA